MKKLLLALFGICFYFKNTDAATFTSNVASGTYNSATSWTFIGSDADGIPDADDDVTIIAGHNITVNTTNYVRNITIQGTLTGTSSMIFYVYGNYVVSGAEVGASGAIAFMPGVGSLSISGSGTFSSGIRYTFATNSNRTIAAGTTITKASGTATGIANTSVTNLGNITLSTVNTNTGATWVNSTNSTLRLLTNGFMSAIGTSFTANALGNTVILQYTTGTVPTTTSGYYNLTLAGTVAGTKTLSTNTVIANNLTINTTNTLNSNGFDLNVAGNWSNSGTFTPGTRTVTFDGTAAQLITRVSGETFYDVVFANAGTKTLGGNITVSNNLTINAGSTLDVSASNFTINVAKNWTNNGGTFTPRAGTVNFNGAAQVITKSTGETFNNIVLAGNNTKTLGGPINANASITINGGVTFDVSGSNYDVTLKGNWINNGTFNAQNGTVSFIGTTAQTLSNSSPVTFSGLTINNTAGVSLSTGTYTLTRVLTINNGTFSTGGRPFTMTSTASQTARIAPITGSGAIAGNFIVQRFITARSATWADLASPVQNSTFADWDSELPARYYGYNPPSDYPTQYSYSESADDFVAITSPSTALTPGKGYEVFLTGSYAYIPLPNTTMDTRGVPNQGNQDLSGLISYDNMGSNLVGNPFASSISWSSVFAASSGIENYYDVYDYTAGNYTSFGLGTEIGSGQGFWVYTNSPAYSLIVLESAKTTSSNSTIKAAEKRDEYFNLKISSNQNSFYHTIYFGANNSASNGFAYGEDRLFHKSINKAAPNITCTIDNKKLNLNMFNANLDSYSVPLSVYTGVAGNYTIAAEGFDFINTDYSCIVLEDALLNKFINLTEQNTYSFLLNTGDTDNRFVLHFSKSGNCKSMVSNPIATTIENQVQVLPTENGNTINFNFDQTLNTTISVVNTLGQNIVENNSVQANTQCINIALPEGFTGMYIIKIENQKGTVTKKFIKK